MTNSCYFDVENQINDIVDVKEDWTVGELISRSVREWENIYKEHLPLPSINWWAYHIVMCCAKDPRYQYKEIKMVKNIDNLDKAIDSFGGLISNVQQ